MKNSVCFFEFDADFPMARHSSEYVTVRKNIYFVVRSVYTVGNYDCMHVAGRREHLESLLTSSLDMFSYEFWLDGSIKISVRASGYIAGQTAIGNEEYGYRIHGECK